jgi:hypothetical protein
MNGDHLASGGTRSVSIDGIVDDEAYAGMARESITDNGPDGAEVKESANRPWESAPTATRTIAGTTVYARHTGIGVTTTRTDLDGGRSPLTTTVTTTFDPTFGYPTQVADSGDDARTDDDRCTVNTYANNTTAWIIGRTTRVQNYALPCGQDPTTDADVISDLRTYYDNQAFDASPTRGDVTQTDTAKAWAGPSSITWMTTAKTGYDAAGTGAAVSVLIVTARSSMLSAPAAIPAMIAVSFGGGLAAPDLTRSLVNRTCSPSSRDSPACSASPITGTRPAHDTRFSSSNTALPPRQA